MLLHVPHSAASSERSKGPSCVAGHVQWSARSDPSSAGPAVPSPLQPSTHPVTCTITIQHMYVCTYVCMLLVLRCRCIKTYCDLAHTYARHPYSMHGTYVCMYVYMYVCVCILYVSLILHLRCSLASCLILRCFSATSSWCCLTGIEMHTIAVSHGLCTNRARSHGTYIRTYVTITGMVHIFIGTYVHIYVHT